MKEQTKVINIIKNLPKTKINYYKMLKAKLEEEKQIPPMLNIWYLQVLQYMYIQFVHEYLCNNTNDCSGTLEQFRAGLHGLP